MNILMLTSVYPQQDDLTYKTTPTVQYFCREWQRQGHNVIVIHNNSKFPIFLYYIPRFVKRIIERITQIQIPNIDSRKNSFYEDKGVRVYRRSLLKFKPHTRFSKKEINRQGNYILKVLEENSFNPDVIIGHWANPQAELIDWLKNAKYTDVRTALVFHNDCELKDVERYSLSSFIPDRIGCRNNKYALQVKQNLSLTYTPFICSSGLDNSIVEETDITNCVASKTKDSIIYVGRLQKYKKVDALIKALSLSVNNNLHLLIVGSGLENEYLRSLMLEKKLSERVSFIDSLTHNEVFDEMKKHEIFAMISENEVFGMVYLEAMLMGCITIATKGCAIDGIIEDGVNGFLCEAGNDYELSQIFNKISLMSAEERQKMQILAYQAALNYSDEKVANRYLENVLK